MPKINNLVGMRFGSRTVLRRADLDKTSHGYRWVARCDCGHESAVIVQSLRRNASCPNCAHKGPRPYRRKRPLEAVYNALVGRGHHPVWLSYDQFVELASATACHYCGGPINWTGRGRASNLDRKDNSRPYETSNVVVCCARCNKAKNTHFTYDEWRQLGAVIRTWSRHEAKHDIPPRA